MADFKGTDADLVLQPVTEANKFFITNEKTGRWLLSIQHNGEQTVSEQTANINLILAGRDLLEALQDMIRMYEEVQPAGGWQGVYEGAVYAVNKATKKP